MLDLPSKVSCAVSCYEPILIMTIIFQAEEM